MPDKRISTNEKLLATLTEEEKKMTADEYYVNGVHKILATGDYVVFHDGQNDGEPKPKGRVEQFEQDVFYKKFEKEKAKEFDRCEVSRKNKDQMVIMNNTERYVKAKSEFHKELHFAPANLVFKTLKEMNEEDWIALVCNLFDVMPSLINLEDLDINRVAFTSPVLSAKGMSTCMQLEVLLQAKERKEQYLNIYVLNKMFAKLLKNDDERAVFKYILQGNDESVRKVFGSKLRTAYRLRNKLLLRIKDYCLSKGYDRVWFYDHFAELPPIMCAVEEKLAEVEENEL